MKTWGPRRPRPVRGRCRADCRRRRRRPPRRRRTHRRPRPVPQEIAVGGQGLHALQGVEGDGRPVPAGRQRHRHPGQRLDARGGVGQLPRVVEECRGQAIRAAGVEPKPRRVGETEDAVNTKPGQGGGARDIDGAAVERAGIPFVGAAARVTGGAANDVARTDPVAGDQPVDQGGAVEVMALSSLAAVTEPSKVPACPRSAWPASPG